MTTQRLEDYSNGFCPDGQPHVWFRPHDGRGFPSECKCVRCERQAPEPFCRTLELCSKAGRCMSEIACNE